MKCLILAGGKGNSLWPLSREEYPKQFMSVRKNRSLLQETVARNIPFCDEFLIATNAAYHFIVEGQMKVFQGLKYRCILEEEGRKTAPAIALACMYMNPSELVYVVSADQIIEGTEYKETVMEGKRLAKQGKLVTFGMEMLMPHTGYGYIKNDGEKVLEFKEKPDIVMAQRYFESGEYLWNSGNFLFCAGDFLNELKMNALDVYQTCTCVRKQLKFDGKNVVFSSELLKKIPAVSVEKAVFEHSDNVSVVKAKFHWWDIGDLKILSDYMEKENENNIVSEECENVTIINRSKRQLVVANGIKNVTIVNTEDVCYVVDKNHKKDIKQIIHKYPEYSTYFEKCNIVYRPWGTYEILNISSNYKMKKLCIYPGKTMDGHRHAARSEQWSVVQGTGTAMLDGTIIPLPLYSSLTVPVGANHAISNWSDEDLIVMEVSFGAQIEESDREIVVENTLDRKITEKIIKCEPLFKDYLWGGTKLRDFYKKHCDYDTIAESWELSAHEDGQCSVASGPCKGMLFGEYLKLIGEEALGWKCYAFEKFPLLIKFIDAKNQLSVQVHPDDEYALLNENEYGKNEMWYVMECEPDASIYFGLKRSITSEELRRRAEDNTITEVLNEVKVHKGDTFFVSAGTIHAIGKGIMICEIQQNSNCTYRLYDYARKDKFGNMRQLHLDKAISVANTRDTICEIEQYPIENMDGYKVKTLCECKYFTSVHYEVEESVSFSVDETSFSSVVILDGSGIIKVDDDIMQFHPAESFFIHAGKWNVELIGACSFILTRL